MNVSRASAIPDHLPYLRRFARALTGTQDAGDGYAARTLEAILEDPSLLVPNIPLRTALFRVMYDLGPTVSSSSEQAPIVQQRLSTLASTQRVALLLQVIEELSLTDIAQIMQISSKEVRALIDAAYEDIAKQVSGHVMIIEDESLIAADLAAIVAAQGHNVTGIADTKLAAIALGKKAPPDLILSDIQLADHSSGIDAVNELLEVTGDIPVIFITAFPEMLLTGDRPEPAFVIPKPYTDAQVHSAVSQAMFFASVDGMVVSEGTRA